MKIFLVILLLAIIYAKDDYKALSDCAKEQIGKPFAYGKEGPDAFDNFGLLRYCVKKVGKDLKNFKNEDELIGLGKESECKEGAIAFQYFHLCPNAFYLGIVSEFRKTSVKYVKGRNGGKLELKTTSLKSHDKIDINSFKCVNFW